MLGLCLEENIFWQVGRLKKYLHFGGYGTQLHVPAGTDGSRGTQGAEIQHKREN